MMAIQMTKKATNLSVIAVDEEDPKLSQQSLQQDSIPKVQDYLDIMVIGRKGVGKSTMADKILIANPLGLPYNLVDDEQPRRDEVNRFTKLSDLYVWHLSDNEKVIECVTERLKELALCRSMQDPHIEVITLHNEKQTTEDLELISNDSTKVRVLDVPGFYAFDCQNSAPYNNHIMMNILHIKMTKFNRIIYFLPEKGVLERHSQALQTEIAIMENYFGKSIFESMVVVATYPDSLYKFLDKSKDLFPEKDRMKTKHFFDLAMKAVFNQSESIPEPPIIFISLLDTCEDILHKITKSQVTKEGVELINNTNFDFPLAASSTPQYGKQDFTQWTSQPARPLYPPQHNVPGVTSLGYPAPADLEGVRPYEMHHAHDAASCQSETCYPTAPAAQHHLSNETSSVPSSHHHNSSNHSGLNSHGAHYATEHLGSWPGPPVSQDNNNYNYQQPTHQLFRRIHTAPQFAAPVRPPNLPRQSHTQLQQRVGPRSSHHNFSHHDPYNSLPANMHPLPPNRSFSMSYDPESAHHNDLPPHFTGVYPGGNCPHPQGGQNMYDYHNRPGSSHFLRHMSSTTTESSEEGSINHYKHPFHATHSEPSLRSFSSSGSVDRSFQHSYSVGSGMAKQFSQDMPVRMDFQISTGNHYEPRTYIAALLQQRYTSTKHEPWTVIFTVYKKDSPCIKQLTSLLNDEYGEEFTATAVAVKLSSNQPGEITLKIPKEEMLQQGYRVTTLITPRILEQEVSQQMSRSITATYPPRHTLHIIPVVKGDNWQNLNVSLDLDGIDNDRKFKLTNPQLKPASCLTQVTSKNNPIYTLESDYLETQAGNSPTLTFTVTSDPPLTKDTQHTLSRRGGVEVTKRFKVENSRIIFHKVKEEDSGMYIISCHNDEGQLGEATLELDVMRAGLSIRQIGTVRSGDISWLTSQLCKHACKWKDLGRALNFQQGELDNIEQSSPTTSHPQELLSKLLSQWSQWPTTDHRDDPTMEMLCDALRSGLVGLGAEANALHETWNPKAD